jgi:uncharacterized protein (TIGR03382 family)
MKSVIIASLGLAALAGTANASIFFESEGNNSAGTANAIPQAFNIPGGSVLIDGSITGGGANLAGDVDWFQFTVTGTATVVASIFSLNNTSADSELYLVSGDGTTILAFNDDGNQNGGSNLMSSLIQASLAPGNYYLVVTGDNDAGVNGNGPALALPDGFDGAAAPVQGQGRGHGENFDYKFLVGFNVIPTPGAAAILGLGALAMGRRRR